MGVGLFVLHLFHQRPFFLYSSFHFTLLPFLSVLVSTLLYISIASSTQHPHISSLKSIPSFTSFHFRHSPARSSPPVQDLTKSKYNTAGSPHVSLRPSPPSTSFHLLPPPRTIYPRIPPTDTFILNNEYHTSVCYHGTSNESRYPRTQDNFLYSRATPITPFSLLVSYLYNIKWLDPVTDQSTQSSSKVIIMHAR